MAESYGLEQIITAAVNCDAEALRGRGSYSVSRLEETLERYLRGGELKAKINLMESEREEVRKLRQVGKYRSRHQGDSEDTKCDKCIYQHCESVSCPEQDV